MLNKLEGKLVELDWKQANYNVKVGRNSLRHNNLRGQE